MSLKNWKMKEANKGEVFFTYCVETWKSYWKDPKTLDFVLEQVTASFILLFAMILFLFLQRYFS